MNLEIDDDGFVGEELDEPISPEILRRQPHMRRRRMAEADNVLGLFRAIMDSPFAEMNTAGEFARLYKVIRKQVRRDPIAATQQVIDYGLGAITYLTLRTQFYLETRIAAFDLHFKYDTGSAGLPSEVTDVLLPRLLEMHRHLAEIVQLKAATERQQELTRAKRLQNNQATQAIANNGAKRSAKRLAKNKADVQSSSRSKNGHTATPPHATEPRSMPAQYGSPLQMRMDR